VFILLLIKPPAATGQSHSSAKFSCPDTAAPADKISDRPQAFLVVEESGRRLREDGTPPFWPPCFGLRFAYTAPRQLRRRSGPAQPAGLRHRQINGGKRFTVAAEFIKKGPGMCQDQHCVAFLNVWSALFDES
jgi:hypothetical protein